jgi:hypothetical protein
MTETTRSDPPAPGTAAATVIDATRQAVRASPLDCGARLALDSGERFA